jgi:hypothetical protein
VPGTNTIDIEFDLDQFATSGLVSLPANTPLYLDIVATTSAPVSVSDLTPGGPHHYYSFTTPITFDYTTTLTDTPLSQTLGQAGGVPEPASWALLLLGFGGIGAQLRRRKARSFQTA